MPAKRVDKRSDDFGDAQLTLPSDLEIRIVRAFAAPREIVFDAWTKPDQVAQWWDPTGERLVSCTIDLRPNCSFRFHPRGAPPFVGVYREIVPPERLVFSTVIAPSGADATGTLLFEDRGRRTILTLRLTCASKAERDALLEMRVDIGTLHTLENLNEYVARLTAVADGPGAH